MGEANLFVFHILPRKSDINTVIKIIKKRRCLAVTNRIYVENDPEMVRRYCICSVNVLFFLLIFNIQWDRNKKFRYPTKGYHHNHHLGFVKEVFRSRTLPSFWGDHDQLKARGSLST